MLTRMQRTGLGLAALLLITGCGNSGWAFALAFDREIDRLTLENERAPRLRVFLKS
jgi:hypothetical protein